MAATGRDPELFAQQKEARLVRKNEQSKAQMLGRLQACEVLQCGIGCVANPVEQGSSGNSGSLALSYCPTVTECAERRG